MKELEPIVAPLLAWYQENKRDLPWRKNIHPYKTWVSEIMLQQTRVEAVKDYFARFMKRLPTIEDLATVEEDELLKLWEGLGYYNRVRNMQKMAQLVVNKYQGIIPDTYDEIQDLPGIGPYTAGAILSIAYNKKIPCVDGNVLRVITRVLGDFSDITKEATKKKITAELAQILPDQVGDFNQSLMELGALVCLPNGLPLCQKCPLFDLCEARKKDLTMIIPVKAKKKERRKEEITVFLLFHGQELKIEKRTDQGLLASLYQLPNTTGHQSLEEAKEYLEQNGFVVKQMISGPKNKHIFSHIEWNMISYIVKVEEKTKGIWVTPEERQKLYSLPTAFDRLLTKYEQEK